MLPVDNFVPNFAARPFYTQQSDNQFFKYKKPDSGDRYLIMMEEKIPH